MNPHIALLLAERHIAEIGEGVSAAHRAQERRRARRAARCGVSSLRTAPRRAGVIAMLAGAAVIATAISAVDSSDATPAGGVRAAETRADQVEPNITLTNLSYAPGHTSGWHVHPGVHSVVVLGGVLTVIDEACTRHEFGPGSTYLGGRLPHLARNDAAEELAVVVTSVYEASRATPHGASTPVPAGCDER